MNSDYWKSQYDYYMSNQPPKAESYYNKDFIEKMNEARSNIDNLVAERDKAWAATQQAQDDYNAFRGTMSSYNEVYTQSKSEFGIEEHQQNYENSKKALALAESSLEALPSSINAASNRVLTQSQREARYNALADRQNAYKSNLLARSSAYEEVWKKARESQAAYAQAEIASQYQKLGDYNNAWAMSMNNYLAAQNKVHQGEVELSNWSSQYRSWQHQQYENAQAVWLQNMSNALDRYMEALDTEMTQRQADISVMRAEMNARRSDTNNSMANALVAYHQYQQAGK
jgi:hypothetical protein